MNINYFKSEVEFVDWSVALLRKDGNLKIAREVPILGRSADVVILKNNVIISIEYKMKDWRSALKQARDYKLVSDYSYICIPSCFNLSDLVMFEALSYGVGILIHRESSKWPYVEAIKAPRSNNVWKYFKAETKEYIIKNA